MADLHTSDQPTNPRFTRSAAERLRTVSFPLAVRGYDRRTVDEFLEELHALVSDLESRQTREGVVQKALDELGEETAGILQRAHATADEIAARSRAQADGRLQRAEREAEIVRREADEYAEKVIVDTRLLWEERQRLIEDIRQLADEVLATADDAAERVKIPEPIAATDEETEGTVGLVGADIAGPQPLEAVEPLADEEATIEEAVDREHPAGPEDESGHTVELEALPGGPEEPTETDPNRPAE
jgi:DivIVA domain-containing protein